MNSDFEEEEAYKEFLKAHPNPFAHKSKRHHYIPQFYLKGFTNSKGLLYVYDKEKDSISEVSTKSVFFEWDRNSIGNGKGDKMSLLEDSLYASIDTRCAQPLINIRESVIDNELLNSYNIGGLDFFILNLFIRNPKYDVVFDDFIRRSKVYTPDGKQITDEEYLEKHFSNEGVMKSQRAYLAIEAIKRFKETKEDRKFYHKLVDIGAPALLCSDFPIVNLIKPSTLEGILQEEYFFPVSARRIYFSAKEVGLAWSKERIMFFNTMVIDECVKYVCSPDKHHLAECIKYYKNMKRQNLLMRIKILLWQKDS